MNKMWQSDQGDNTYINPVLYADYSDPDVIRVGDTYYMTASSFNCVPGLPILISKDLINWELVNYAVKEIPYEVYNKPAHAKGIWAPSIRYHDNKFWIYFGMPDEGIFMTQTEDPLGEWSPLVCVKEVKGWIDPCPLWDEDGNAYLIHAFAKSRVGFNGVLDIVKMSYDGTKILDEGVRVIEADPNHRTIEGPKFYKRDGYYYIFAPAGGVPQGWQLVMRSKNVYGPYEMKIVLHQGDSDINGPHQGGLVDDLKGDEWFMHFQDADVYGRIVHLQPVRWEDGWPMMGIDTNDDGIGEPVRSYQKPYCVEQVDFSEPPTADEFESESLGLQWQWYANVKSHFYSLSDRKGWLRLNCLNSIGENSPKLWNIPNLLIQKLPCPSLSIETLGDFSQLKEGDKAGLLVIGKEYAYLGVTKEAEGIVIRYTKSVEESGEKKETVLEEIVVKSDQLSLYLNMTPIGVCKFGFAVEGKEAYYFDEAFIAEDSTWMGAKVGLFGIHENKEEQGGYVDFNYFRMAANASSNNA